ncbi:MAG: tetratricopeptide repeat protein [Candidatus Marinimicrobia bacterium]|nr:tetratricopeptide repeat protein [Candidatus Neomarinimicrobiota bacterium]
MLTKYSRQTSLLLLFIFAAMFLVHCVPPPATETETATQPVAEKKEFNASACDKFLSFAYSYYQNQDWKGCIKNYNMMLENGCEEEYASDIFYYLGRAYRELKSEGDQYLDSAAFAYQKGLEYLPGDEALRKNLAYVYRLQGKTDFEIREYEKLSERDPENIEYYKELSKLYFKAERYEDVTWAAEKILAIEPSNQQAVNDRMLAFEKLGKDVSEVQKEAWESNPSAATGLQYATALEEKKDYTGAIEVLKQVTNIDPTNFEAWSKLGTNYRNIDDKDNVVKTYSTIISKISPRDLRAIAFIVEAELALAKYTEAYDWAKRALTIDENDKTANKLLGDVYYGVVEFNTSSREVTFEDKLVYKLAYDAYKKASSLGEFSVKSRLDYLKEYRIPTDEDWFMNKYDSSGKDRTSFKPQLPEYSFIGESAQK